MGSLDLALARHLPHIPHFQYIHYFSGGGIQVGPIPQYMAKCVTLRCTVIKVPYLNKGGGRVLMLQNYPPLNLTAEALISSPLSLTLEPSTHDHHLPFYLFPLNPLTYKGNIKI